MITTTIPPKKCRERDKILYRLIGLRKYEDIYRRIWFFEIVKWEFIVEVKKWKKFKNPFKVRRVFHFKF